MEFSKQPPRYKLDNSTYFLTFNTFDKYNFLHRAGIPEFLINELKFYSQKIEKLIAYTIMPTHIHLLLKIINARDLTNFLRDFKKYSSKQIKEKFNIKLPHIWMRGTMDHVIREIENIDDFFNHLSYLFYNSKKHLNILPKDFPYHNFLEFVERDYFDIDFCDYDERPYLGKMYE